MKPNYALLRIDFAECREELSKIKVDQQLFRDQLQEALGVPKRKDQIWFGAGLLSLAKSMRLRAEGAESELARVTAERDALKQALERLHGACKYVLPQSDATFWHGRMAEAERALSEAGAETERIAYEG